MLLCENTGGLYPDKSKVEVKGMETTGEIRGEISRIFAEAIKELDRAITVAHHHHGGQRYREHMEAMRKNLYSLGFDQFMGLSESFAEAVTLLHITIRGSEKRTLSLEQMSLFREALVDFQTLDFGSAVVDKHWNAFFNGGIDVYLPFRG